MVNAVSSLIAVAGAALPSADGGSGPVSLDPTNTKGVPGSALIGQLADGIGNYSLFVAMIGVLIGSIMWGCTQRTLRKPWST